MESDDATFKAWRKWQVPLDESQVEVVFDRERGNAKALTGKSKELAEKVWGAVVEKNPRLFNATKFRLAKIEDEDEKGVTKLLMGITDYKTFLTTNRASDPDLVESLPDPMEPVLANVLGVSALVITTDGYMALQRRSFHTGEFKGWWDVPGGHPEPSRAKIDREGSFDAEEGLRARKEFFQSAMDEVHEELNVPYAQMGPPRLMGVVQARASRWRPSAIFLIPLRISSEELGRLFIEGGTEAEESTSMALFQIEDLENGTNPKALLFRPKHNSSETNKHDDPEYFSDLSDFLVPSAGLALECLIEFRLSKQLDTLFKGTQARGWFAIAEEMTSRLATAIKNTFS